MECVTFHAIKLLGQERAFVPDRTLPASDPDVSPTSFGMASLITQIRSGTTPRRLAVRVFDRMVAGFNSFWPGEIYGRVDERCHVGNSLLLWLAVLVVRGHARPCQFGCPADFGAGHVTFKDVPQLPATFGSVCTSDVGPHVREHGILEGACPVAIHESEEILRGGITCSTARRYQRAASASSVRTTALSPKNQDQEFISGQRDVQWPYC